MTIKHVCFTLCLMVDVVASDQDPDLGCCGYSFANSSHYLSSGQMDMSPQLAETESSQLDVMSLAPAMGTASSQ